MEVDISNYSKKIKALREKKVTVRPIRRKGGWVTPDHDSAFLNEGSARNYTVPAKSGGSLVNPCPDFVQDKDKKIDDWQTLADELGLEHVRVLNPNTKKDNFWKNPSETTIKLDRNGKHLNLSVTQDFIDYLVLRSNSHMIAPCWAERFESGEYMFALVEEGEEMVDKVSNIEEKKTAYGYLGKIDKSAEKMTDFLYVYYLRKKEAKRPPRNGTVDWLKGEIGTIIETDLKIFLEILDDDDYILKLLIQRSVETGALLKDKHVYSLPGADEPIGVLEDLVDFLDDPKNQQVRMKLMHHVEEKVQT